MKAQRGILIAVLYIVMIVLGQYVCLFIYPNNILHFIGASSLAYAFIIPAGLGSSILSDLMTCWIVIFLICIIISIIKGVRTTNYSNLCFLIGSELVVTFLIVLVKLLILNNTEAIGIYVIGNTIRCSINLIFILLLTKRLTCRTVFKKFSRCKKAQSGRKEE